MKSALDKLKEKQQFVLHYLQHFNAARAAREAGYSEKSDRNIGSENLTKPDIQAAVAEQLETVGVTPQRLQCLLAEIIFDGDVTAFEEWVRGSKTMEDLRAEGVNTMLIQEISEYNGIRAQASLSKDT